MPGRTITLPSFRGVTRTIVLSYVAAYFGLALLNFALPKHEGIVASWLALMPTLVMHGFVWQLFTYSYVTTYMGVLSVAFSLLLIWFTASTLEEMFGHRWLTELFYITLIGGGLITTLVSYSHIFGMRPDVPVAGLGGLAFAMMVVFGVLMPDAEFLFFFVISMRAKYIVLLYVLIDTALLLHGGQSMSIALEWGCGLSAALFVKLAPRRGFAFGISEFFYGLRNSYYRRKRRRAAKKFEVYMRDHNREVHFDAEGRYISPEDAHKESRDPKDRSWMN